MMAWARVDDRFFAHPKVVGTTLAARGLWVTALSWSSSLGTDGRVPRSILPTFVTQDPDPLVEELVTTGLWERVVDGYQIHDYLDWNPSREMREAQREATNARALAYRQRHASVTRDGNGRVTRDEKSASRCSLPCPALPSPSPEEEKDLGQQRRKRRAERAAPLPPDFKFTEERRQFAEAGGVPDPALEFAQFRDHHRAKGSLFYDWEAAWKNWCRNAVKYAAKRQTR